MATKIIILGQEPKEEKKLKPIEFKKYLSSNLIFESGCLEPSNWMNIELICRDYACKYDLMFAYDDIRIKGTFYLGHFNDGVVE